MGTEQSNPPPAQDVIPYATVGGYGTKKLDPYCRASLYVSLISWAFPLIAAISIILASVGLMRIRRNGKRGVDYAVIAIVLSILGATVFLGLWSGLQKSRSAAMTVMCASNLRQIGQAMYMYENTNPHAKAYGFEDLPVVVSMAVSPVNRLQCPLIDKPLGTTAKGAVASSYVMLSSLLPMRTVADPASTAIVFEITPHPSKEYIYNVLFADGHVEAIGIRDLGPLIEKSLLAERRGRRASSTRPVNPAGASQGGVGNIGVP